MRVSALLLIVLSTCQALEQAVVKSETLEKRVYDPVDHRSEKNSKPTTPIGSPSGKDFTDASFIGLNHRRIGSLNIGGCQPGGHVTGLTIGYRNNKLGTDILEYAYHGTTEKHQTWTPMSLALDEFIQEVRVTTWNKKVKKVRGTVYRTRVGHIKFTTNKNNVLECGAFSGSDPAVTWGGAGKALLFFSGSQGDAIDQLQGHFIPASDH